MIEVVFISDRGERHPLSGGDRIVILLFRLKMNKSSAHDGQRKSRAAPNFMLRSASAMGCESGIGSRRSMTGFPGDFNRWVSTVSGGGNKPH
ncbi:MAG TPA: hypothetical protein VFA63_17215 [Pseudonocardiaceae bacterium]|nr:hypothetical protein [Pseudonocardiaceae bacterium]